MKKLLAKLLGIPSFVWNFYGPLLAQLVATGVAELLPAAFEIVKTLSYTDKTGQQKRDEAILALKAAAVRQGINATESALRWTIESAVQRMKAEVQP